MDHRPLFFEMKKRGKGKQRQQQQKQRQRQQMQQHQQQRFLRPVGVSLEEGHPPPPLRLGCRITPVLGRLTKSSFTEPQGGRKEEEQGGGGRGDDAAP